MNFPNIPQLIFQASHKKDKLVSDFVEDKYFIFFLVSHVKSYFDDINVNFRLSTPFLDPTLDIEQQSHLSLNDFEIGEISLNYNSVFDEVTLVYSSASGLLKTYLIDSDSFKTLTIAQYLVILHEFSAMLRSEFDLYNAYQKK